MTETVSRLPFGMPRDVGVLALTAFVWGLGEGLFIFFLPLALQRWPIDAVQIGAVLSLLGLVMAVMQAPAGYLADRFGALPLIRASFILGIIAAVMMAAAASLPFFVLGLVAYTMTSMIAPPRNSYITQMRGGWSAQRGISFVSAGLLVGEIFGPTLGGWIAQTAGLAVVFRYSAGLFLIATIIGFQARRPPAQTGALERETARGNPFRNPRLLALLAIIFFTIVALSTPQQLSSVYLQDIHQLSLQQIGLTGTFAGIGGAVILFALGSLPPAAGMITGQLLLGLFCLLLWRGQSAAVFYTGYLFAGGSPLFRTMAAAAVRTLVSAREMGLAYGLVETGNALAVILAPLAAGLLYQYQPQAIYTASLIALGAALALTAAWVRQSARG